MNELEEWKWKNWQEAQPADLVNYFRDIPGWNQYGKITLTITDK